MIPDWAHVGAEVVCVEDFDQHTDAGLRWVHKGRMYVIRWVGIYEDLNWKIPPIPCIRLIGIERTHDDKPFALRRFRPVVRKSQTEDVAMFERIVNMKKIQEDV